MTRVAFTPEWVALCAGVKPALRVWRARRWIAAEAAAGRRRGFAIEIADHDAERAILYVAATPADARRLRELEAAIAPGKGAGAARTFDPAPHRALGAALGYPPCCVEAFVTRIARGVDRTSSGANAHEDFVAVSTARAASRRLDLRCNIFAADHAPGWVSHVACRFDCPASLAYADQVIAAFRALDPAGVVELNRALATAVAIEPDGQRRAAADASPAACVLAFDDPP